MCLSLFIFSPPHSGFYFAVYVSLSTHLFLSLCIPVYLYVKFLQGAVWRSNDLALRLSRGLGFPLTTADFFFVIVGLSLTPATNEHA